MRRVIIYVLAAVGMFTLVSAVVGLGMRQLAGRATGVVLGLDERPLAQVPVFLDRGSVAIERFVTDSDGAFTLALAPGETRSAVWLICAPGAIPMVGRRGEHQYGPTTYGYTQRRDSTWGSYRANGWRGPIPRECPRGTDTLGWRYPPTAGKSKDAITTAEPDWPK